jgi:hypothetical protein
MKMKANAIIGLLVTFVALACVGTLLRTPISRAPRIAVWQDGSRKLVAGRDEKPATAKHLVLGDGVELWDTAESRGGEVVSRHTKVTRNGETLLTCSSVAKLRKAIRTYYHDGKEILSEVLDEDGNVETLILVGKDQTPLEVYERKKDGTTLPVGSERLKEMQKGEHLIRETFRPIARAVRDGTDERQIRDLVEDAVKKTREAAETSPGDKGRKR